MPGIHHSALHLHCDYIVAEQWVFFHLNSPSFAQWQVYRRLEGGDSRESTPPAVGPAHDTFPIGSIAVDGALSRVLYCKDHGGWRHATDEESEPTWAVRTLKLKVIEQVTYGHGNAPAGVSPVWYNTPMPAAKDGNVELPSQAAFDGPFAKAEKQKFTSRLRFPLPSYDSKQRNLHRNNAPITRQELAKLISEDVEAALAKADGKCVVDGRHVKFQDLYLVDVRRVSEGSVQATLAILYVQRLGTWIEDLRYDNLSFA